MYKKTSKSFGQYQVLQLTNEETGEYFSVIPELGGRVHEICLTTSAGLIQVLENEKDPGSMNDERWYRGCLLAPFPNRVQDGSYEFSGKRYQLDTNMPAEGHAIHGIMYNKVFADTVSQEENVVTLVCKYEGSIEGYPFPCTISYNFQLSHKAFSCTVKVLNTGKEVLPFGFGWHPYFTLGEDVDTLALRLPDVVSLDVDERMIPTGNKESFSDYSDFSQIHDTQFDTGFEILRREGIVKTSISNQSNSIILGSWQTTGLKGFNYIQIFTPPGRRSIAVEPMTCPANAFNSKESLIEVSPNEEWFGSFGVEVR